MDNDQTNGAALDNQQDDFDTQDSQDDDQSSLQNAGHDDQDGDNDQAPQNKGHGKDTQDYSRLKTKVSKLEKELAETKRSVSKPRKELTEEDRRKAYQIFSGNKALYDNWRSQWVREGGVDYGAYEDNFPASDNTSAGATNSMDSNKVNFIIEVKDFVRRYPEFDVDNAEDDDDAESRQQDLEFIFRTAAEKQARAKRQGKSLSREDAIEQAVQALDPEKYTSRAREEGTITGMQAAYNRGLGSGIGSGSAKGKGRELGLTDDDRQVAKMLGISEEAMLNQKKNSRSRINLDDE